MLDSGFNNLFHEALDHLDIVATWDFVNGDADVYDQEGQMGNGNHGTHTLSVIAGFEPGELIGPAYGASFLLGKTENTEWERHIEEDHWIAGAEWADSLGADIISSSLGYRDQFTQGDIDYTWEHLDGKSTIVARGANIAANPGNPVEYDLVDGTSFSCPLTAGVAAVIQEINPAWTNEDVMEVWNWLFFLQAGHPERVCPAQGGSSQMDNDLGRWDPARYV